MGFAADAVRQQQWMHPGLALSAASGFGGYYPTGLSTPSSATSAGPLTPDGRNHLPESEVSTDKTTPVLPPVYRLSSWLDFTDTQHEISDDENDDLASAAPDRPSDALIITAGWHDKPQNVLGKNTRTTPTWTADDEPKPRNMAGPTYTYAVSTRPLTAREYQRYRSQRRGDPPPTASAPRADSCAGGGEGCIGRVPSGRRRRSGSDNQGSGQREGSGVMSGETVAMRALGEKMTYRMPRSSPAFMTKEEFEALPPAIQRKVSYGNFHSSVRAPTPSNLFPFIFLLSVLSIRGLWSHRMTTDFGLAKGPVNGELSSDGFCSALSQWAWGPVPEHARSCILRGCRNGRWPENSPCSANGRETKGACTRSSLPHPS